MVLVSDASFHNHIELEEGSGDVINEYAEKYRKSEEHKKLQEELKPILEEAKKNPVRAAPDFANNFFWQVCIWSIVATTQCVDVSIYSL